jgi:hypothetical protein
MYISSASSNTIPLNVAEKKLDKGNKKTTMNNNKKS